MIDLGKHAVFIWASYAAFFAVVAGLLFWLFWDGRRQARQLSDLEARGVKRRSARPQGDAS